MNQPGKDNGEVLFAALLVVALAANGIGTLNGLFPQDSAVYAVVSKQIAVSGNWGDLFLDGRDWLDKPHFPFWMSALSMRALGVSAFAYKLPGFAFFLLSLLYTYLLARDLCGTRVARMAVLLLSVSGHVVVSSSDLRAEPFLMGLLVAAVYHGRRASTGPWVVHLVAGSLFTACALMTKGIFLVIPVAGAIAGDALLRRRPGELFRLRWLFALALVAVFVLPEVYAVYRQFDLHPEKTVFGRTGVSGVRFFFWDSQFGRFVNTGPIQGKGNPFFFLHTVVWAFAPWGLILYPAVLHRLRSAWRGENREYVTLSASLPLFLVFSVSGFQLPHYLNILFPFFSILVADWALSLESVRGKAALAAVQYLVALTLAAGMVLLQLSFRPGSPAVCGSLLAALVVLSSLTMRLVNDRVQRAILVSAASAGILGVWVNAVYIPALLSFQACPRAAACVNSDPMERIPGDLELNSRVFEFYLDQPVRRLNAPALKPGDGQGVLVYTDDRGLGRLTEFGWGYRVVETWKHYDRITTPTLPFFHHGRRGELLKNRHLVEIFPDRGEVRER